MLINKDLDQIKISTTQPTTGEEVWIQKGKNLYNKNASFDGYALYSANGQMNANNGWTASDYMPVQPNTKISISGKDTQGNGNCFYDKNKNFISTITGKSGTITSPANAYYMRINLAIADKDTCQIEQNSSPTAYEAYVEKNIYTKNANNIYEEFYDKNKSVCFKTSNNILSLRDAKDITINDVTFTVDKTNGTITANGTASAQIKYYITGDAYATIPLENGKYRFSGCPSGGATSNGYRMQVQDINSYTYGGNDTGYGVIFNGKDGYKFYVRIIIDSGVTVSNLVFYPQLVKGEGKLDFDLHETKKMYIKNNNDVYEKFYEEPLTGGYLPDGGYVIYPDGTIIQYGTVSMTTGTTSYTHGGMTYYASDSITIDLPTSYTMASSYTAFAQVQGADTGSFNYMYVNNIGSKTLGLRFLSTSSNYTRTISWYTIGRKFK